MTDPEGGNDIYTIILTGVENVAAIFRKMRTGALSLPGAMRAVTNYRSDWQTHYQIVEVNLALVDRAMALAEKYGLRGYDAAHLASALAVQLARHIVGLQPLTFVLADLAQLQAAATEGLIVEDPNRYR